MESNVKSIHVQSFSITVSNGLIFKNSKTANLWLCGGINYPDSPHSQGGMKFATRISPLLNLKDLFYNYQRVIVEHPKIYICEIYYFTKLNIIFFIKVHYIFLTVLCSFLVVFVHKHFLNQQHFAAINRAGPIDRIQRTE